MAEHVQIHMERMVEEFEEMTRTEIFSDEEIRIIKNKRENFENKVCGIASHTLLGFRSYIDFEYNIYKLIKARRSKFQQGEKVKSIDQKILRRISNLYLRAIKLYPDKDIQLYFEYFIFCRATKFVGNVAQICSQLIKCHSSSENAWLTAAQWYMYSKQKNYDLAIKTLQKGIAVHKNSKILYIKCIEFELDALTTSNEEDETIINNKLKVYFEDVIMNIAEVQFYADILKLLTEYSQTMPAQLYIVDYLEKQHLDKALTWNILAKKAGLEEPPEDRINTSIAKYKKGLEKLETVEKVALWDYYLKYLYSLCKLKENSAIVKPILVSEYNQAANEEACTEFHFINWLDVSTDRESKNVLELGTRKLMNSVDLWLLRLRFCILTKDSKEDVLQVFESAVDALQSDSYKLWLVMSNYYPRNCNIGETEEFFKLAIKEYPAIFSVKYIEWLAKFKTIEDCRKAYSQMTRKFYSKELFKVICKIEMKQSDRNYVEWQKVYDIACAEYGKEDVGVWLSYIKYYINYNKVRNSKECIIKIIDNAKKSLNDELFLDFKQQFDVLYEGYSTS